MTYVHSSDCDELRVILCLEFDPHAQPERVAALKSAVIDSPKTIHSVEVTGDFDFMSEIAAGDLGWFNRWWTSLGKLVATVVSRCEKSFICRRFVRGHEDEQAFWVRRGHELRRLDHLMIDKIVAEGDYARVYSQGQSWLLHATMHSLFERLGSRHFVQLHRSVIIRNGFIERLVHENDHWVAFLGDGTSERVARSHAAETLKIVRSSSNGATSPNSPNPVDHLALR